MGDITHFVDDVTHFIKWAGTGTWNHALRATTPKSLTRIDKRGRGECHNGRLWSPLCGWVGPEVLMAILIKTWGVLVVDS